MPEAMARPAFFRGAGRHPCPYPYPIHSSPGGLGVATVCAKLFGITTSLAVMKINTDLGYRPVTFAELTDDHRFWEGCRSCPNFDVLTRTKHTMCLCTAMLYEPDSES